MPDTDLLTDQQIAEIEARHKLASRAFQPYKEVSDSLSDIPALIATVKQLREQLFEEQARNQTQADSIMDAESEITSLQSQLEQLRAENEALRKWQRDVEEREAAVCPEDVPFDEYIWALKKRAAQATEDRDELSTEMETCHSLLDQFYAEDPVMTSADTLEKRLKLHLDELRPVITDDDVNGDD